MNFPLEDPKAADISRSGLQLERLIFLEAAAANGLNLRLVQQPPNSPDTNINDLSFFRAIDALQQEEACTNYEELIQNVKQACVNYSPKKLNNMWITHQQVMLKIMETHGFKKFKMPHMGKEHLERLGQLQQV